MEWQEKLKKLYRSSKTKHSESNLEKWMKENPGKSVNDYYNKIKI